MTAWKPTFNEMCMTPNGPGIVEAAVKDTAPRWILIRHVLADMTTEENGYCFTPKCISTGLWAYPEETLRPLGKSDKISKKRKKVSR